MPGQVLKTRLFGEFCVCTADGADVTPKSKRGQAVLALLLTSPGMRRSRKWLMDHLWSDRMPEQAGGSLRQTLSELRRCLRGYNEVITITRDTVSLNPDSWSSDLESQASADVSFLEGFDLRDPRFEKWLKNKRSSLELNSTTGVAAALEKILTDGETPRTSGLRVGLHVHANQGGDAALVGDILTSQIGRNIADHIKTRLYSVKQLDEIKSPENDINVDCRVVEGSQRAAAFLKVQQHSSGLLLYSRTVELSSEIAATCDNDRLSSIAFSAAENAVGTLLSKGDTEGPELAAARIVQMARAKIFSFQRENLVDADELLLCAQEVDPNPIHLAWRAFIRNVQFIERLESDRNKLVTEARELLDDALNHGGDSPLVLSLCAFIKAVMLNEGEAAMELAYPALEANPNSAFALQSIATVHVQNGNLESAYFSSKRGHEIAKYSGIGHWWDLSHCLVCIATGRNDEAIKLAETAVRKAPHFRPPLRNLLALQAMNGNTTAGNGTLRRLSKLEPDFTLKRFLEDPAYPNRTLRNAGLLEFDKSTREAVQLIV